MRESTRFAYLLYEFTNRLAKKNSNPVLEILDSEHSIIKEVKYPFEQLQFGKGPWRAYYHCHDSPIHTENEHGHFHIFYQLQAGEEKSWAHICCLTLDGMGQALNWIVLNRWVTDGPWLTLENLRECLDTLNAYDADAFENLIPVEGWLLALLGLYQSEINQLYCERDQQIKKLSVDKETTGTQEDRQIYGLSQHDIDLYQKLSGILPSNKD